MNEYRVIKLFSNHLNKDKRIFLYLPKSYVTTDKFYPVLYMHDGQNLFDDKIAFDKKSWGIMESYIEDPAIPEVIIVGIESDEDRADELVPYQFKGHDGKTYGGKADRYLGFIVEELKPFIDKHYRTFKSPKNTGLMGSSFGGVNATYAALKFGKYFTRFGCISNAYYYGGFFDTLQQLAMESNLQSVKKLYMDCGTKESQNKEVVDAYIDSNKKMYEILKEKIDDSKLRFEIVKDAIHHESAWEKRFPDIMKFMYND